MGVVEVKLHALLVSELENSSQGDDDDNTRI